MIARRGQTPHVSNTRMNTVILPTHTPPLFEAAVERAAALLRAGELVALPTETVYGLAANALDSTAVEKIFAVKGRPAHNPIIVHVADAAMARQCVGEWPAAAERLTRAFWPGPLTLVLRRSPQVPMVVTAGGETVGVRWPSHPFMQAVIRRCGFPLAAPSANVSNAVSPTNAGHVERGLWGKIPLIIDGGQSQVGIESTVVDLSGARVRVLRPGMIHAESLAAALGVAVAEGGGGAGVDETLRSPGLLRKHYAPRAKLVLWSWRDEQDLLGQVKSSGAQGSSVHVIAHTHIPTGHGLQSVSVIPHDAEAFARAIYGELHRCDAEGADWIVVETLPEGPEWRGVADRLARAGC